MANHLLLKNNLRKWAWACTDSPRLLPSSPQHPLPEAIRLPPSEHQHLRRCLQLLFLNLHRNRPTLTVLKPGHLWHCLQMRVRHRILTELRLLCHPPLRRPKHQTPTVPLRRPCRPQTIHMVLLRLTEIPMVPLLPHPLGTLSAQIPRTRVWERWWCPTNQAILTHNRCPRNSSSKCTLHSSKLLPRRRPTPFRSLKAHPPLRRRLRSLLLRAMLWFRPKEDHHRSNQRTGICGAISDSMLQPPQEPAVRSKRRRKTANFPLVENFTTHEFSLQHWVSCSSSLRN